MATVDWRRGLLKALLPVAGAFGFLLWRNGGAIHGGAWFWVIVALLIVPEVAASLASTRLRAAGDGAAGLVEFAGLAWLFGGCVLLAVMTKPLTLTNAERADFVAVEERGQLRLRHPTLGFSFLHPGPGFAPTGAQAFRRDAHFYSFADPAAAVGLTIGLFKGQGDARALRKLLETMSREAEALGGPAHIPTRVVELETSAGDAPAGHMHVVLGDGRHYRVNAYHWQGPDGPPFAILIAVMSRAPDAGEAVLASFRP